jgi:hypothetical protein
MTWKSYHDRGAVLRDVIDTLDARRDGLLPMDVTGVTEAFGDELTLLGALQLRWHTRLAGRIDAGATPTEARRATAHDLPGVRAVIDHYTAHPLDEPMARATALAARKERVLLMEGLDKGWGTLVA